MKHDASKTINETTRGHGNTPGRLAGCVVTCNCYETFIFGTFHVLYIYHTETKRRPNIDRNN